MLIYGVGTVCCLDCSVGWICMASADQSRPDWFCWFRRPSVGLSPTAQGNLGIANIVMFEQEQAL